MSENYVLSGDNQTFFLKKYRFDNAKRIEEIHASKKCFADGGIPVILPIPLLNSKTFFEYKGALYTLFPFVEGFHLERGNLTDSAIVSLGKMLGRIHLLGRDSQLSNQDYLRKDDKVKTLQIMDKILAVITAKGSLDDFDKMALENIQKKKNYF